MISVRQSGVAALIAFIITAGSQPPFAVAYIKTGNDVLTECSEAASVVELGECDGYIEGIADAMGAAASIFGSRACYSQGVTFGQAKDATLQYLQFHIGDRNKGAAGLVAAALAETFPCQ